MTDSLALLFQGRIRWPSRRTRAQIAKYSGACGSCLPFGTREGGVPTCFQSGCWSGQTGSSHRPRVCRAAKMGLSSSSQQQQRINEEDSLANSPINNHVGRGQLPVRVSNLLKINQSLQQKNSLCESKSPMNFWVKSEKPPKFGDQRMPQSSQPGAYQQLDTSSHRNTAGPSGSRRQKKAREISWKLPLFLFLFFFFWSPDRSGP